MSDVSMHRKQELAQRVSQKQQGVGNATPREEICRTEWASPVATALTIQNQAPEQGWSFR